MSSTPSPDFPPRPDRADRADRVRDVAPMLHWLLEMLVCLHAGEGLDVLLRPGGDRRREIKLHLPACDRQVLERLLELLRGMGGEVVEEGENPGLGPEVEGGEKGSEGGQPRRGRDGLTPLMRAILVQMGNELQPLKGATIARRLGRPYSGQFRACLRELVEAGMLDETEDGRFEAAGEEEEGASATEAPEE